MKILNPILKSNIFFLIIVATIISISLNGCSKEDSETGEFDNTFLLLNDEMVWSGANADNNHYFDFRPTLVNPFEHWFGTNCVQSRTAYSFQSIEVITNSKDRFVIRCTYSETSNILYTFVKSGNEIKVTMVINEGSNSIIELDNLILTDSVTVNLVNC
ncbi:hypothetical protein SAMN06265371_101269 [Lutibacter agarilyticus]|uniref:Uncharacterized protein n=1 Tax=Lutibacter agarilyticus TaxID=1109740 RepID=A0A238VDB7_9FLAO|nr:hypothetical protein [Lutibacter agarilyticus]SNR32412.1 hypothetical protein SAMN06265371_101269 [Lutibacter agarilyticus]